MDITLKNSLQGLGGGSCCTEHGRDGIWEQDGAEAPAEQLSAHTGSLQGLKACNSQLLHSAQVSVWKLLLCSDLTV